MTRFLMAIAAIALVVPAAFAADPTLPEGNWRLSQKMPATEFAIMLVKVEKKDSKLTTTVIDKSQPQAPFTAGELKVVGTTVTLPIELGRKFTFEGVIDPKDPNIVRGAFYDDASTFRAVFTKQEGDKIEQAVAGKPPEPMAEAQKLTLAVNRAMAALRGAKDPNDRAELQGKLKDAQKESEEKVPGLYREVIAKHADSPFAVDAATALLRMAAKVKPTAAEVTVWAKLITADAEKYGARIARDSALSTAEILIGQKDIAATALPLAENAVKSMKDADPLAVQARGLKVLMAAQKAAGKTDASIEARFAKVDKALDVEYATKVPGFKPAHFEGRKDKSANKVAVMELFTGAQCPPCVAADAAFDALEHAYTNKDLILIQYHMHIPGPDPMTNKDTMARWDYYGKLFPGKIGGVPSSLFGGKPAAGGGGGLPNAESKFKAYTKVIDELVEEKTDVKVMGSAKRAGDKISINVELDGVKEPSDKIKLRVVLVEDKIKYVGGNGMRFHHQVVRALPGGVAGMPVTEKSMKKTVDFDVAELKKTLAKYLEEFNAERPFPNPERPLDMSHLKVIAMVQDDATGEILNAAEFEVQGK
jgi:hypothetical protein